MDRIKAWNIVLKLREREREREIILKNKSNLESEVVQERVRSQSFQMTLVYVRIKKHNSLFLHNCCALYVLSHFAKENRKHFK